MLIDAFSRGIRRRDAAGRILRAALLPTFLAATLSWLPVSSARAQGADEPKAWNIESGVDENIKPGDDFFAYANGAWLKATEIPIGKERWSARNQIEILTRQRVGKLLDDARAAPSGSDARKVADYRAAYLNQAALDAKGLASIKPLLDSIDRVKDKAALTRALGRGMRADVDPLNWGVYKSSHLLGLSVEPSIHGEKNNVAFLVQGGLGLPDRENYVSIERPMQAMRTRYQEYVGKLLALAGFDRTEQRAEGVMALETAIALSQATREASAIDHNADRVWTRADFAREAPGMDWSAFFTAAGLGKQENFVAWQPTAATGVAALVASQPVEAWKDYLRFHVLDRYADVLPHPFAEEALAMQAAEATGGAQTAAREQRALDATQLAMGDAIGKMYVERYFPVAQRTRVQAIVANVAAAFARRVDAVTWMSPKTRTVALAKLKKLYVGIGYPERWQDYSDLIVDPTDAAGNLRRATERNYRRAVARLGQPIDMREWCIAPQQTAAILVFQQNAYEFSAALLQAPKFDPAASDAAAYGAIGALLGHDVTHFVDVLGAEYDVDGGMHRWWTAEDSVRLEALAEPLVDQFNGYQPFPGANVDGKLTRTENMADLGGLTAAFDAYRLSLGKKVNDREYVRQHDREFFIAFAQSFRTKMNDAGMRTQLASDHAPEMYRVATVRNLDAWYGAFDVQPGQRLYVEPRARVKIW